ncbi:hypothetical protein L198_01852 [Cryptococcus wingfieldii CBS 7118]|uniref:Uncharacterized protein n=1 Tax=Cryptococcus wingfieldii CBS 7118 TaxID=1295528 RepID=A0A1E3JWD4_9TREE|nr:hypothetical protein L198_01852 [Cryptococcus wingfieldii CBS 7118]ODO05164.1 hypothetical protein L198_01852 [Cryptococcus wingfieldii CBS 7118]
MSDSSTGEELTYHPIEDARSLRSLTDSGDSAPDSLANSMQLLAVPSGQTMSGFGSPSSLRSPNLSALDHRRSLQDDPTWTAEDSENDGDVESIITTYSQLPGTLALPSFQVNFPDGNTPRQLTMFDPSKDRGFVVPRASPSDDDPVDYQVILSIDEWHQIYALWDDLAFPRSRINEDGQEEDDGFARLRVIFEKQEKAWHLDGSLDQFMFEIRAMLSTFAGNRDDDDSDVSVCLYHGNPLVLTEKSLDANVTETTEDFSIVCEDIKLSEWFKRLYNRAREQAAPGESLNPMRISLHVGWHKTQTVEGFAAMEEREKERQTRLGLPEGRLGNELDMDAVRMARESVEEEEKEKERVEKASKHRVNGDDEEA